MLGYWDFEEGSGTTANDRSGNNYTGTITGAASYTSGILGGALDFGGSNYVSIPSGITFALNNSFSVCAWFKYDSGTGSKTITGKNNSEEGYGILQVDRTNGKVFWTAIRDAGDFAFRGSSASGGVTAGTWNFACGTYDGSDTIGGVTLYVNGTEDFTVSHNYPELTDGFTISDPFLIGGNNGAGSFDGSIDEVRVYSRVLSSGEVSSLYNEKKAKINASQVGKLTSGLVGYWTFDGADMNATQALDKAGSNNGTLSGTTKPSPAVGKVGQGLNFNGSTSYIDVLGITSAINPPFSIGAWIKLNSVPSANKVIVAKSGSLAMRATATTIECVDSNTGRGPVMAQTWSTGQWYYITCTIDVGAYDDGSKQLIYVNGSSSGSVSDGWYGSDAGTSLKIGSNGTGNFFDGLIDEVRYYNRTLSQSEITELYQQGQTKINASQANKLTSGLVGYWTMDGQDTNWTSATAGTMANRGSYGGNGTITNLSQTSTPVIGKIGQGMRMNGTNGYISLPSGFLDWAIDQPWSISFWGYADDGNNQGAIFGKADSATGKGISILFDQNNTWVWPTISSGAKTISIVQHWTSPKFMDYNIWQHWVVTYDGTGVASGLKVYLDSTYLTPRVMNNDTITVSDSIQNSVTAKIGNNGSNGYSNAKVDEFRVYNRVLSASEVSELYNMGR